MDEPQARIDGVIRRLVAVIVEAIGDHALIDVSREKAQHLRGFLEAIRAEQESRQRDHRVASPVGEPGITGEDGHAGRAVGGFSRDDKIV